MLRRLRLPLPLTERTCRCRRVLDPLGDHRSVCPRSGVLRSRGCPLERAAARVFAHVLQPTPSLQTSTFHPWIAWTAAALKSLPMASHCSKVPSWPYTPPSSPPHHQRGTASVTNPVDVLKTRLQVARADPEMFPYSSALGAARHLLEHEGAIALMDGVVLGWCRTHQHFQS